MCYICKLSVYVFKYLCVCTHEHVRETVIHTAMSVYTCYTDCTYVVYYSFTRKHYTFYSDIYTSNINLSSVNSTVQACMCSYINGVHKLENNCMIKMVRAS